MNYKETGTWKKMRKGWHSYAKKVLHLERNAKEADPQNRQRERHPPQHLKIQLKDVF